MNQTVGIEQCLDSCFHFFFLLLLFVCCFSEAAYSPFWACPKWQRWRARVLNPWNNSKFPWHAANVQPDESSGVSALQQQRIHWTSPSCIRSQSPGCNHSPTCSLAWVLSPPSPSTKHAGSPVLCCSSHPRARYSRWSLAHPSWTQEHPIGICCHS